jgi:hypothetical protein
MKKYALTCLILCLLSSLAVAQLTLKKTENNRTIDLPLGSLIEVKFPTETRRPDCNCFETYKGYLRSVQTDSIGLVIIEKNRETIDDNKAAISDKFTFRHTQKAILSRIRTSNALVIHDYSLRNQDLKKVGGTFILLSIVSNLFFAPAVGGNFEKTLRNMGYGGMVFGAATFLLPTKRSFYLSQPKNKKKTLWKLDN